MVSTTEPLASGASAIFRQPHWLVALRADRRRRPSARLWLLGPVNLGDVVRHRTASADIRYAPVSPAGSGIGARLIDCLCTGRGDRGRSQCRGSASPGLTITVIYIRSRTLASHARRYARGRGRRSRRGTTSRDEETSFPPPTSSSNFRASLPSNSRILVPPTIDIATAATTAAGTSASGNGHRPPRPDDSTLGGLGVDRRGDQCNTDIWMRMAELARVHHRRLVGGRPLAGLGIGRLVATYHRSARTSGGRAASDDRTGRAAAACFDEVVLTT